MRSFTITEKALTTALSWLKAPARAFTFETLLHDCEIFANLRLTFV